MMQVLPNRPSATAAAEQALRDAILSGELAAGDRLPPERVLSKQLGISRLTLRAALATLSASGLIDVRHGSGYTVRDVRESGGTDLLPGLIEATISDDRTPADRADRVAAATDLLRLRRHLAGAVLEAISERTVTAKHRHAIHAAIDRFAAATDQLAIARSAGKPSKTGHASRGKTRGRGEPSVARDGMPGAAARSRGESSVARGGMPGAAAAAVAAQLREAESAIVESDLGVVRALLDASGSMILRVCLNPIIRVLRESAPLRAAIYARPETNLVGWRALGVWIDRPDAAAIPVLLRVLAERDRATAETLRKGSSR